MIFVLAQDSTVIKADFELFTAITDTKLQFRKMDVMLATRKPKTSQVFCVSGRKSPTLFRTELSIPPEKEGKKK